ncbi:MAG TPA: SCO family protein [Tepidisphaeraceae bacterium]|jgi:protein SCO1/2
MTRLAIHFSIMTLTLASPVLAQSQAQGMPPILKNVGIHQNLGQQIPLDAEFRDSNGADIRLRDCLRGKPVLLMLVYYQCPMLCTISLNQLSRSLNVLSENAGEQFDILTVSFDPTETSDLAAAKKRSYLRGYSRPSAEQGWHFLTGSPESIHALCSAAGFNYAWDPQNKVFAHASALIVLSPKGKITRYFLGVDYPPTELRQAITQADEGSVSPPAQQIFLYCFHYDPATGRYGLIIDRAIRAMGIATVLALAGLIGFNVMRERRRQQQGHNAQPEA